MTPAKAIKAECKRCLNITTMNMPCPSKVCKLKGRESALKRIKAHCLTCAPEQHSQGVKRCDGRLMEGTICVLHRYRMGRNPRLARKGSENAIKKYRFTVETHAATGLSKPQI